MRNLANIVCRGGHLLLAAPPLLGPTLYLKWNINSPEKAATNSSDANVAIAARTQQAWVKVAIS